MLRGREEALGSRYDALLELSLLRRVAARYEDACFSGRRKCLFKCSGDVVLAHHVALDDLDSGRQN